MAEKKIGAKIVIDGEEKFRSGMTACKSALANFKSELALTESKYRGNANSLEALTKKQESLKKIQGELSKKTELLSTVMERANEEYTKEKAKLEESGNAREKLKKELEEATKQYGENSEEVKKLQKELESSNKEYSKQENALQKLGNKINYWGKELNDTNRELDDVNKELTTNNKYVEEAEKSYDNTARSIDEFGNEVAEASGNTNEFNESIAKLVSADLIASSLKRVGSSIANIGREALTASVEIGAKFESSMSQVAATMALSADEIENCTGDYRILEDAARQCGKTTKYSAGEAADALNYLALAGYTAEKAAKALPAVLNLAAAGNMDLAYASDLVTDSMAALGMEMDELVGFTDEMAVTSQKSNTSISQLGEAILTVGGTAKQLAGGTVELNTVLGILADNGIKGAEGGTALRNVLKNLTSPTKAAAEEMKTLGISAYDTEGNMRPLNETFQKLSQALDGMSDQERAQAMNKIFDSRVLKSAETLIANCGDRFNELSGYIGDADGAAARMAATMSNNLQGKTKQMQSALEELGISFYSRFEKPMKDAVEAGTEGIGRLTDELNGGELGESVDRLAESVGELTEELLEGAEDVLPKVIDGVTWVIDNGGNIVGVIEGIGAAYVTYKAATAAATIAQTAFNVTANMNPYIMLATGIAGAAVAITHFAKESGNAAKIMSELTKESKEEAREAEKLNSSIEKAARSREADIEKARAQSEAAKNLVGELDELTAKYDEHVNRIELTAEQQAHLADVVSQLNSVYPELGLALDEHTGLLNMDTRAIYDNIDAQLKSQEAALAEEHMAEITKQKFEAQMELYELNKKHAEQLEEVEAAENKLAETTAYGTELFKARSEVMAANDAEKALQEQIDATNESIAALSEEYEYCKEIIGDTSSQEAAVNATGSLADAAAGAGAEIAGMSDEVAEAYGNMYDSIEKAVSSSMSIFEQFKGAEKAKTEDIQNNLQSQIDGYNNWGDSIQALAERTDVAVNQEILSYLANMGIEGAGYVQAFNEMTAEELSQTQDLMLEALSVPSEVASKIADSWLDAGENATKGAVQGITGGKEDIAEASKEIGEAANKALLEATDEHSPSKIWEDIGGNLDTGLIEGINGQKNNVTNTVTNLGNEINRTLKSIMDKDIYRAIGVNVPSGLAEGIRSGKSEVINAAIEVAQAAADAAKATLKISSPSKVFEEIAQWTGKGYIQGWRAIAPDMISEVNETMSSVAGVGAMPVTTGINASGTDQEGVGGIRDIHQNINIYSMTDGIIETSRKFRESMQEAALAW